MSEQKRKEVFSMMDTNNKLRFESDYMEGALPQILEKLLEHNLVHSTGYGLDDFSESAREKIRTACQAPNADIYFLAGGTQVNSTVISALLKPWQGVMAPNTGHINVHESGAVEYTGHKVIALEGTNGKISAEQIEKCCRAYDIDPSREHTVMPGMVYISHPTELGTLYTLEELTQISNVCRKRGIPLFLDGARLAYALACPENDVTLPDLAKLCSVFYIGGTKCGALFGEAVVIPEHNYIPHFFSMIKQHGALLAKGHIAGIQFDTLFTDNLYVKSAVSAVKNADRIRRAFINKGYTLALDSPANQIFVILDNEKFDTLIQSAGMEIWEKTDDTRTTVRITTSWATTQEETDRFIDLL